MLKILDIFDFFTVAVFGLLEMLLDVVVDLIKMFEHHLKGALVLLLVEVVGPLDIESIVLGGKT